MTFHFHFLLRKQLTHFFPFTFSILPINKHIPPLVTPPAKKNHRPPNNKTQKSKPSNSEAKQVLISNCTVPILLDNKENHIGVSGSIHSKELINPEI